MEHELQHRTELRSRSDDELEADYYRAKFLHVRHAHGGDPEACSCTLEFAEAHTDVVLVAGVEDVDGGPAGVATYRIPITGATWKAPPTRKDDQER